MGFMTYDVAVIGAGHAGCEAALACSRMGFSVYMAALDLNAVALMPCNPSIGGTGKGQLVREVDALGGEMGLAIDETFVQSRMLNLAKGPAVQSLRAQADKAAYAKRMRCALEEEPRIDLREAEIASIIALNGQVKGVKTASGETIPCGAVVVACGVYLKSRVIIGETSRETGPMGLTCAGALEDSLMSLGFEIRRFKTGTPARIFADSIDFSATTPQPGDEPVVPFSFMTDEQLQNRMMCYLTYTNEETHRIIRENLHRAPMYSGGIRGIGARYCPSIEDKVVKFADKTRHSVFLEPEGISSVEWYVQGMSTSMPEDVQERIYRTIPGLEKARFARFAYAIEYDVIDSKTLDDRLASRDVAGLFFAGQVVGTSGYEEAAAQGIYAGINAALYLRGQDPMLLSRSEAYIGVMVDDLVFKGTDEPYRMMTSRAEYRLSLRQDDADQRLTERAYAIGLASEERYARMIKKREEAKAADGRLASIRDPESGQTLKQLLKRPEVHYEDLLRLDPEGAVLSYATRSYIEVLIKYEGYLNKQRSQVDRFAKTGGRRLSEGLNYMALETLRIEARQKLAAAKPRTLAQAAGIPGVTPGDIQALMIYLRDT